MRILVGIHFERSSMLSGNIIPRFRLAAVVFLGTSIVLTLSPVVAQLGPPGGLGYVDSFNRRSKELTSFSRTETDTIEQINNSESTQSEARYLTFNVWGWNPNGTNLTTFKALVDSARARGFNTISFSFAWWFIESTQNQFDFAWLDRRVDYIVQQGLFVQLRVTYSIPPSWIGDNYFMRKEDGSIYQGFAGHKVLVISDEQVRAWMERVLVKTVERYQARYVSKPVVYYSIPFAPVFESEYAHTTYLDYSPQARAGFQEWLQSKYANISDLNQRWSASLTTFSQIDIPKSTQYGSSAWVDWMNYRTFSLKRLFDLLALAVHNTDPDAKIGVQVGDNAMRIDSGARGTYDIVRLVENIDWVIFESIPSLGHKFSMDILRTLARGKRIGQEVSPAPCPLGSPISFYYFDQALDTYDYGGDMVHYANWDWSCINNNCIPCNVSFNAEDAPINYPDYVAELAIVAQAATQPVTIIPEPQAAMYVSTMMQYLYPCGCSGAPVGVDTYEKVKVTYQLLTEGESVPVAILTDHAFSDNPLVLNQYTHGIYFSSFNQIIADDAYAALIQANVPLYAEDSGVGTKNEYGDSRAPTIFSPYPPAACIPTPCCCSTSGDANDDASVNIADITYLIARIFAGGPAPSCADEGDANGDNSVNIADVTYLIARIFAGGAPPVCGTTGI